MSRQNLGTINVFKKMLCFFIPNPLDFSCFCFSSELFGFFQILNFFENTVSEYGK